MSKDATRELIDSQAAVIANLRSQLDLKDRIIDHHETIGAWRTAVRSGHATTDEMAAAMGLEDKGEVASPLPRGYIRHEGRIVRIDGTRASTDKATLGPGRRRVQDLPRLIGLRFRAPWCQG